MGQTLARKAAEGRIAAIRSADLQHYADDTASPSTTHKFPSIESVLAAFDRSNPLINAA